jgi:hypothetical protein
MKFNKWMPFILFETTSIAIVAEYVLVFVSINNNNQLIFSNRFTFPHQVFVVFKEKNKNENRVVVIVCINVCRSKRRGTRLE